MNRLDLKIPNIDIQAYMIKGQTLTFFQVSLIFTGKARSLTI